MKDTNNRFCAMGKITILKRGNSDRIVSVVAGKADNYVRSRKPSELIPFRGKFPIVEYMDYGEWNKAIGTTKYLEDLPEKWQRVALLGARVFDFEESFKRYLLEYGLSEDDFLELKNTEKSNKLIDWMERKYITWEMFNLSYKEVKTKKISRRWIRHLAENEIFVFGSNLSGFHRGGAAALAMRWGAAWGKGVGLHGQTYAIPTMQGGVETIKPYVDDFLSFAKTHSNLKFLVTEIGCGIAGFTVKEIAPLFIAAMDENMVNVYLPKRFYEEFVRYAEIMNERGYRAVSVLGVKTLYYVQRKRPSEIIPFRGKFPMVDDIDMLEYRKAITTTEMLEDLPEKWQRVVMNGARCWDLEESFTDYLLTNYCLFVDDFLALTNMEKSEKIENWMNQKCIGSGALELM